MKDRRQCEIGEIGLSACLTVELKVTGIGIERILVAQPCDVIRELLRNRNHEWDECIALECGCECLSERTSHSVSLGSKAAKKQDQ